MGLQSVRAGNLWHNGPEMLNSASTSGKSSLPTPLASASRRQRARCVSLIAIRGLFPTRRLSVRKTGFPEIWLAPSEILKDIQEMKDWITSLRDRHEQLA